MHLLNPFRTRSFWLVASIVLLFNGLFFVLLLLKPGTQDQFTAIDGVMQTLGYLIGALLCMSSIRLPLSRLRAQKPEDMGLRFYWMPFLLGLAFLLDGIGQAIYTYYDVNLQAQAPFPSWADFCFLLAYPFQFLGILAMPVSGKTLSHTRRVRVLLDGLLMMTAVMALSWYFVLGPTMLGSDGTLLAKLVEIAYPCFDLVTFFCVFLLANRSGDGSVRLSVFLLSCALLLVAITDTISQYQTLQNSYATGTMLDLGWPLAYTLAGLAIQMMYSSLRARNVSLTSESASLDRNSVQIQVSIWRILLPYALVPAIILLSMSIWHSDRNGPLAQGVYLGGCIVILLMLARQLLSLRETQQLNKALSSANSRLEALSRTDPLTDLPNHRTLLDHLDVAFQEAQRAGTPLSVIFFDGDRFKRINDTYGHPVGDAVLCELGTRVKSVLRSKDMLGRYGGEEFLVILPETTVEQATVIAERMRNAVAEAPLVSTHVTEGLHVTISLGTATYPTDAANSNDLLECADQAMYWAKRLGRNQVRTYAEAEQARNNSDLAATMHALERSDTVTAFEQLAEQHSAVGSLLVVQSLLWILELRDRRISHHAYLVSDLATALAQELGLSPQRITDVATAALLHDIGMIGVPDTILQKVDGLLPEECALLEQHPQWSANILEDNPALQHLVPAVLHHHERWDGLGYPARLSREQIPLEARLIAVAEAYQTMIRDDLYEGKDSRQEALNELLQGAGSKYDPQIVQAALKVLTVESRDSQDPQGSVPFIKKMSV